MARGKKKETLTPEERLQAALVPESEQPYKVPENWCWTALKHISSHISDGSHNPPKDSGTGIPLLSATNIHDHLIDIDSAVRWITEDQWIIENQRTKIETNDVLLTIVASLGRTAVVKNEQFALQRSVAVIKPKINSEFFSYYFETPYIQQFLLDNAKGTAQKGFYLNSLAELFCCVPPLPEQQRIVDRIESLFAKLDEAKQKAQDALDSFETRKAAILHKAFTGELTAQWRKEHGVGMESWEEKTINDIGDVKGGKRIPKGMELTYENTGHPYLKAGNLKKGTVIASGMMYVTDEVLQYIKNYTVSEGDVYITNVGACIGDCGIIPQEYDGANLTENAVKITNLKCNNKWLSYYLSGSSVQQKIKSMIASATLGKLSIANIKKIGLNIPMCLDEQTEIIRILDNFLAKEQQAKETAERVLEQIDLIKKAILARAFRGELGTNDPTEESAEELISSKI